MKEKSVSQIAPQSSTQKNLGNQSVLNSEGVKITPVCLLLSWDGMEFVSLTQLKPLLRCFSAVQSGNCSLQVS